MRSILLVAVILAGTAVADGPQIDWDLPLVDPPPSGLYLELETNILWDWNALDGSLVSTGTQAANPQGYYCVDNYVRNQLPGCPPPATFTNPYAPCGYQVCTSANIALVGSYTGKIIQDTTTPCGDWFDPEFTWAKPAYPVTRFGVISGTNWCSEGGYMVTTAYYNGIRLTSDSTAYS